MSSTKSLLLVRNRIFFSTFTRNYSNRCSVNMVKSLNVSIAPKFKTNFEQRRFLLSKLVDAFGGNNGPGKKLKYEEKHLLGYSMEQMFAVVSQVEHYHEFVPWCKESTVVKGVSREDVFNCRLTVGFPPLLERYTSTVTTDKPFRVKSVCSDNLLFNSLLTIWTFSPGPDPARKDTCILNFFVEFEFKLSFHSHLTQLFFDEVVKKMVRAFLKRAEFLYGPQSVKSERLTVLVQEKS